MNDLLGILDEPGSCDQVLMWNTGTKSWVRAKTAHIGQKDAGQRASLIDRPGPAMREQSGLQLQTQQPVGN
jgi:hypothetical protein